MNLEYQEEHIPGATKIFLNASSLKASTCMRRYGMMVNGIQEERDTATDKIFAVGSAVHKVAEQFTRTGGDIVESVSLASKRYPDVDRALLIKAATARPRIALPPALVINGELAVEVTFEIPWYSFVYDGVTYQFVVCGTIDHLSCDGRAVRIYDFKTSRYRAIEYAIKKYNHDTQFKFYAWALWKWKHRMAIPMHVANLIDAGHIAAHVVPILVEANPPRWHIGPEQHMTPTQFEVYEAALKVHMMALVKAYLESAEAAPTGMLNNSCQYCGYKSYCHAKDPLMAQAALTGFAYKQYNPLNRNEED
jgi:CRISPR/Cas system-associated exonuclease Cas4 (RecB family)